MDPITIATLAEEGVSLAVQIYNQVKAAQLAKSGAVTLKPIAELLADADAKFAAVEAASGQ